MGNRLTFLFFILFSSNLALARQNESTISWSQFTNETRRLSRFFDHLNTTPRDLRRTDCQNLLIEVSKLRKKAQTLPEERFESTMSYLNKFIYKNKKFSLCFKYENDDQKLKCMSWVTHLRDDHHLHISIDKGVRNSSFEYTNIEGTNLRMAQPKGNGAKVQYNSNGKLIINHGFIHGVEFNSDGECLNAYCTTERGLFCYDYKICKQALAITKSVHGANPRKDQVDALSALLHLASSEPFGENDSSGGGLNTKKMIDICNSQTQALLRGLEKSQAIVPNSPTELFFTDP